MVQITAKAAHYIELELYKHKNREKLQTWQSWKSQHKTSEGSYHLTPDITPLVLEMLSLLVASLEAELSDIDNDLAFIKAVQEDIMS